MRKHIILILIILSLVIFITLCSQDNNSNNDNEKITNNNKNVTGEDIDTGKEAPDFTLTNHNGEQVSLSDFDGQYVHVELAADWCPYCHAQARYHDELIDKLKNRGVDNYVTLVVLFEDKNRNAPSQDLLKKWSADYGFDYVLSDNDKEVLNSYPFSGTPTNVMVLPNGNISHSWSGNPSDSDSFIKILEEVIPGIFQ